VPISFNLQLLVHPLKSLNKKVLEAHKLHTLELAQDKQYYILSEHKVH